MTQIEQAAIAAFDKAIRQAQDFTPRSGQREMAIQVAKTLAGGTLGDSDAPERSIAVIQAGTGVGKSLAACIPAIVAALERGTRVIFSTSTVALQDQLINKDLPYFASLIDKPFTYALAKGRGRYVCKLKLNRVTGESIDDTEDLFQDDEPGTGGNKSGNKGLSESSITLYKELAKDLAARRWDGEKDTLPHAEDSLSWGAIAADRSSCTGRHCQHKDDCVFFDARKKIAAATIIITNHDLLLASIDANVLPDIENSLLILDEAHDLPGIASAQYSVSMDLTSLRWLEQLGKSIAKVGTAINFSGTQDAAGLTRQCRQAIADLQTLVMSMYGSQVGEGRSTVRLNDGKLPPELVEPLHLVQVTGRSLLAHMNEISRELRVRIKEDPSSQFVSMYSSLGVLAPRLEETVACAEMLEGGHAKPDAKWFSFSEDNGFVRIIASASPIVPGDLLINGFWPRVRSAVLTSATLKSCGSFDFFLRESGLADDPAVTTLEVQSPFDYERQGKLVVVKTRANPKQFDAYNREVAGEFLSDIADVTSGALALFTSKAHLQLTFDAMPEGLRERVLVQGAMSKNAILKEHRARVDAGLPSIIMGLQSFGQGIDLPGAYCETLFVAKLPFSPPTDPIDEARAEWIKGQGGDSFAEISVPATAVKLAQWIGRLIRTETDYGTVICYDKRLSDTGYGKSILKTLPPFQVETRHGE